LVLAVDGSQREEPVVVVVDSDGDLVFEPELVPGPTAILAAANEALDLYRDRLSAVVAVSGPGSYMGVRAGLAVALGVAQSLAVSLALVGSLEVIAAQADPGAEVALAVVDAGRGGTLGQVLEPVERPGLPVGWRPLGAAGLLGRDLPWPASWGVAHWLIGSPGAGRVAPAAVAELPLARDRRHALAWVVAAGPEPIKGYDQVSADYAQPVGVR
jgi:hypothetical protein